MKCEIAIVGYGSIGKRHLSNIIYVLDKREIEFRIDLIRRKKSSKVYHLDERVKEVLIEEVDVNKKYNAVFVTNPTYMHYETIKRFSKITTNMFIEKPAFEKVDIDIESLFLSEKGNYYVACPLRYTKAIQFLKDFLSKKKVYSVRTICSSYLPEWRENTDYRNTYSAHKNQGGGVAIDLIHEWDYLTYLFGYPDKVFNLNGRYSDLEIDSEDLSIYIAQYKDKLIELHLDYFGRVSRREIEIYTKEDVILVDLINSKVKFMKSMEIIEFNEERNEFYLREIENFFDIIFNNKENTNSIEKALLIQEVAMGGNG